MFYEAKNLLRANDLKIERGKDLSFPLHLHGSFEFITVTEGEMKVTVDKEEYLLTSGQALMIFPNQAPISVSFLPISSAHTVISAFPRCRKATCFQLTLFTSKS